MKMKKVLAATFATVALAGSGLVTASPSMAASCGFTDPGPYNSPYYNHCGSNNVMIQIDYPFWNRTKCVGPGITYLDPGSSSLDRPTNAYYIGGC
jgi:Family of unknown function (DUF6355)